MGLYKKLKMQIDAGDSNALLLTAQICEVGGDLQQALFWYKQTKTIAKIKEIEEKLQVIEDEDEDIFG